MENLKKKKSIINSTKKMMCVIKKCNKKWMVIQEEVPIYSICMVSVKDLCQDSPGIALEKNEYQNKI